jgi:hypothetical protein
MSHDSSEFPGDFLNIGQYFISIGSDTPMQQRHFHVDRALGIRLEQVGVGGHVADGRLGMLRIRLLWSMETVG